MSTETTSWLHTHILRGFTTKRGHAWHYDASSEDSVNNHFAGAVPLDRARQLLGWKPLEGTVESTVITDDGVTRHIDKTRKTIIHPTTGEVFSVPKVSYVVHGYEAWLLDAVEQITDSTTNDVDGGLALASVGELKGGAIAWAQFELPDTISTPQGVTFRPFLTAATSLNGTLSSTYLTGNQVVECDNTLSAALGSADTTFKVRHSSNSLGRLEEVRSSLGLVMAAADEFSAAVAALCEATVTDKQWEAFLDAHEPTSRLDKKGEPKGTRGQTNADRVREELDNLRRNDLRCSPWTGTAFGVVQTVNTWEHHLKPVKGEDATRGERNMLRVVRGQVDAMDLGTLATLDKVLASV